MVYTRKLRFSVEVLYADICPREKPRCFDFETCPDNWTSTQLITFSLI